MSVQRLPRGAEGAGRAAAAAAATTATRNVTAGTQARAREAFVAERSKRRFYEWAGLALVGRMPLSSPHDREVVALFLPALIALLLEPLQQLGESVLVGRLGVAELGACGLGTLLFQFALGFTASLIFATTPRVAAAWPDRSAASVATAHGMWVALICGLALAAGVYLRAPDVVTCERMTDKGGGAVWPSTVPSFTTQLPVLPFLPKPDMASGDVNVAGLTVLYLRGRSWGFPAALIMMVAIGASRGAKDMTTPLLGSLAYLVGLWGADYALLPVLGMEGAGYGAALAQWIGAATVVLLLARRQAFDLRDMARSLPTRAEVVPYFSMAISLSVNNLSALAPTLLATSLATALGANHLAAHTVLRQLMGFWLQAFASLNATAHSLIATSLSRQRSDVAAEVLARICQLAVGLSLPLAVGLFLARGALPGLFTPNAVVIEEVSNVLPLLLLMMPLDALGTVLEGGLLGATDTRWIASRTAASSVVALAALAAAKAGHAGLLVVWASMKVLNVGALACDLWKFLVQRGPPGTVSSVAGTAPGPQRRTQ
eukprot:scaffold21.g2100.t1